MATPEAWYAWMLHLLQAFYSSVVYASVPDELQHEQTSPYESDYQARTASNILESCVDKSHS